MAKSFKIVKMNSKVTEEIKLNLQKEWIHYHQFLSILGVGKQIKACVIKYSKYNFYF